MSILSFGCVSEQELKVPDEYILECIMCEVDALDKHAINFVKYVLHPIIHLLPSDV